MEPADPVVLVKALRAMIDLSLDEAGPELDDVLGAVPDVPVYWVSAVLDAWRKYAARYHRGFASEITQTGNVRCLRANMLPPLQFEPAERICRLCGFGCEPPARCWHKACWLAFEPSTADGWKRITKEALKKCGNHCEVCGADFKMLKRTTLTPWRKVYDVDHRVPLFRGGEHSITNVQILCESCHKDKTRRELSKSEA